MRAFLTVAAMAALDLRVRPALLAAAVGSHARDLLAVARHGHDLQLEEPLGQALDRDAPDPLGVEPRDHLAVHVRAHARDALAVLVDPEREAPRVDALAVRRQGQAAAAL